MNKGDKRRNRRKFRVRYDRIAAGVLLLAIVAVVVSSCVKGLTKGSDKPEKEKKQSTASDTAEPETSTSAADAQDTTDAAEPQETTEAVTTEPEKEEDPFYNTEKHEHDDIYTGNLVLVNAQNEYHFPENDTVLGLLSENINEYYHSSDNVKKLDMEVIEHLNSMMEAYALEEEISDSYLYVSDCFRTYADQEDKHSSGNSIFAPGHSDYHTGRTFDLVSMGEDSVIKAFAPVDEYAWFYDNAERFGFVTRFPEEKSEFTGEVARANTYRYVGVPHAAYMNANNLCMDEYIDMLKEHTKEKAIKFRTGDYNYTIYYVPAEAEGATEVPVPKNASYKVSGNNVDGFIVTYATGSEE